MARVNKCKVCLSTDPVSGWAGTNHNLCNECVGLRETEREMRRLEAEELLRIAQEEERAKREAYYAANPSKRSPVVAVALLAGLAGAMMPPDRRSSE